MDRRYLVYHGRWQASSLVMVAPMTLLDWLDFPVQVSLVVSQFIGACMFWYVDKRIFDGDSA